MVASQEQRDAWWELATASTSGRLEDAPKRMESEGRWVPVDESMRLGTHFFYGTFRKLVLLSLFGGAKDFKEIIHFSPKLSHLFDA